MPDAGCRGPETSGRRVDWSAGRRRPWSHSVLAVQRGDIEKLRLLRLVRVLGSGKDPEVLHHAAPERSARHHALDRLLDDALRMFAIENGALAAPLDAAGIAGVPIEDAVGTLVAGQLDLFGIDDDDVVAAIHMWCKRGLMLAAQTSRDDRGEPAEHQAFGVDQQPLLLDVGRFGRES